jgi:heme/copper-type cytochrome/quinol oxidase subunit 4
MSKSKSIFEDERIMKAENGEQRAFFGTFLGVVITAVVAIIAVLLLQQNPNASLSILVVCVFIQILILVVGSLAMNKANNEKIKAVNQVLDELQKEMIENHFPRS